MKVIKLIVLCFGLLLGNYSTFAQSRIQSIEVELENLKKEIDLLKQEEQTPENQKTIKELEGYREELETELLLKKKMNPVVRENKQKEAQMLNDTRKVYSKEQGFHEAYDKYFEEIKQYETRIMQQKDTIQMYNDRQTNIKTKLKDNIARITNREALEIPGIVIKEQPSAKFVEEYSKKVTLSETEKINVRKTYAAARKKYLELEEKKQAAENERKKLESALEALQKEFKGCKNCPN